MIHIPRKRKKGLEEELQICEMTQKHVFVKNFAVYHGKQDIKISITYFAEMQINNLSKLKWKIMTYSEYVLAHEPCRHGLHGRY